ncbi:hypothetical protein EX30DRAFT_351362 [Ascodesmis nigricans]|uniref:Uncharacterized protein n=1 Tax=Ascodesmis nigricans TaxID=341454 RepID=A0A4S2MRS4_9PEZI|nr:hypothetical protein EX30DRAFT_351362 [Ascodesmis nigricans]
MTDRGLLAPPRKLPRGCYDYYDRPKHYSRQFRMVQPSPHCPSSQQQNTPGFKLIFQCHTCEVKHVRIMSTIDEFFDYHVHQQDPDFWVCLICTDAYCCVQYAMLLWSCWACDSAMGQDDDVCKDCEYERDMACVWMWYYDSDARDRHEDDGGLDAVINTQLKLAWLAAETRRREAGSEEMVSREMKRRKSIVLEPRQPNLYAANPSHDHDDHLSPPRFQRQQNNQLVMFPPTIPVPPFLFPITASGPLLPHHSRPELQLPQSGYMSHPLEIHSLLASTCHACGAITKRYSAQPLFPCNGELRRLTLGFICEKCAHPMCNKNDIARYIRWAQCWACERASFAWIPSSVWNSAGEYSWIFECQGCRYMLNGACIYEWLRVPDFIGGKKILAFSRVEYLACVLET